MQNRYGTLHGGCIATLVDVVSTAALVTVSEKAGVSLSMNIDYISPQPGGEEVEITAKARPRRHETVLATKTLPPFQHAIIGTLPHAECDIRFRLVKTGCVSHQFGPKMRPSFLQASP